MRVDTELLAKLPLEKLQRLARYLKVDGADSGDQAALAERVKTALREARRASEADREKQRAHGYSVNDRRAR